MGVGSGGWTKEVKGSSTNWLLQNSHGTVKYSTGNRVAKAHICITHGHGQQCGYCLWQLVWGWVEGGKGGKIGTTVNSIIDKI